jgi:hypothetical protein
MTKIRPGMAEIQAKMCGRRFFARESCHADKLAMTARKATATRFGLYLCNPWMDFSHFFNFENPISIFCKFFFLNIFIQSF